MSYIHECVHCGERWQSAQGQSDRKYCSTCSTKQGRDKLTKDNLEAWQSNGKDYKIPA